MAVRSRPRWRARIEARRTLNGLAVVPVAVAVLVRSDGRVLLAQRLPGTPYAGYWEFPGGKVEPGESTHQALRRELDEELGIEVTRAAPWLTRTYVYPHAHVELNFFRVFAWRGEPHGRDGQAIAWQTPGAFDVAPLLPANTTILRSLELPAIYGISMAEDLGEDAFIERARWSFALGLRLVQLREKSWPIDRLRRFAQRFLPLARAAGARVLLNGDIGLARELGCSGVHWPAATLLEAKARPEGLLCAASCHDHAELARAAKLELDFVVLGPVAATPTHPDAVPLGWARIGELLHRTPLPAYALGGLDRAQLDLAIEHGAHGIALRRAAWRAPA
jgi:8-oxo-dGTP diphosphatase